MADTLNALERYAAMFDAISAESDAHYSARALVRWLKLEAAEPHAEFRRGDDPREEAV